MIFFGLAIIVKNTGWLFLFIKWLYSILCKGCHR